MLRLRSVTRLVLLVVALGIGCGAAPIPSPTEPLAEVPNNPPGPFHFGGTTWRVQLLNGVPVAAAAAPTLVIDAFGRRRAAGWTGCDYYGLDISMVKEVVTVGEIKLNPANCDGVTAELARAYVEVLGAASAYEVDGDILTLRGDFGEMVMHRTVPPAGDPARAVLDAMRESDWHITAGTGLQLPEVVSPIRFSDDSLFGRGDCGFSGRYMLGRDGAIVIDEVTYDSMSCGSVQKDAARDVVLGLLGSAGSIHLDGGALMLRGPRGDLRLLPPGAQPR